jgi:hypothetical protein
MKTRELKAFKEQFGGLTTRTANLIWQRAIKTRGQAKRAIKNGSLRPGYLGYGPAAHRELCAFLGIPTE